MGRLKQVPSRVKVLNDTRVKAVVVPDNRITGRRLQERRWKFWNEHKHCAACGRLVTYPYGFQLDHITALALGGADEEANLQILCINPSAVHRDDMGCHEKKTEQDMKLMRSKALT